LEDENKMREPETKIPEADALLKREPETRIPEADN
jgi:hypothetical protein